MKKKKRNSAKQTRELGLLLAAGDVGKDDINEAQLLLLVNTFLNAGAQHLENPRSGNLQDFYKAVLSRMQNELILAILDAIVGTDVVYNLAHAKPQLRWTQQIEVILNLLESSFKYTNVRRDLNACILEQTDPGHAPAHQF